MQVQPISNGQSFQGSITVGGLSKSQEKVFNGIKNMLEKKVADKDYLILHINGSTSPFHEATNFRMPPKYVIMHTQVKPATVPTARIYTDSLNPNEWLNNADRVVKAHLESDLYQRAIDGKLDGFWAKLKDKFFKLIHKEK